jgi:hypothetical protein
MILNRLLPKLHPVRDVAQPGSALAWGARGRKFESCRPDQLKGNQKNDCSFLLHQGLIENFLTYPAGWRDRSR